MYAVGVVATSNTVHAEVGAGAHTNTDHRHSEVGANTTTNGNANVNDNTIRPNTVHAQAGAGDTRRQRASNASKKVRKSTVTVGPELTPPDPVQDIEVTPKPSSRRWRGLLAASYLIYNG